LVLQDTTISHVTREMENLKTEMREKDIQLTAMQTKVGTFIHLLMLSMLAVYKQLT